MDEPRLVRRLGTGDGVIIGLGSMIGAGIFAALAPAAAAAGSGLLIALAVAAVIVCKTASCAAMALTVGSYVWPGQAHAVAVAAVIAVTGLTCVGVQRTAWATRVIVTIVLAVLAAVLTACLTSPVADAGRLSSESDATPGGVLQAAGLLFFAFAGYARIATLGEEMRDPARTN